MGTEGWWVAGEFDDQDLVRQAGQNTRKSKQDEVRDRQGQQRVIRLEGPAWRQRLIHRVDCMYGTAGSTGEWRKKLCLHRQPSPRGEKGEQAIADHLLHILKHPLHWGTR